MKSAITYFSYSGNTKNVAGVLFAYLSEKGETRMIELQALDESGGFLGQCMRAFRRVRARLNPAELDLSAYELVCFGTPVWAFGPAPAMNTYLDNCTGVAGKKVILFTTHGSGIGNQRCLHYMQDILVKKGARDFSRFSVPQFRVRDKEFLLSEIKKLSL